MNMTNEGRFLSAILPGKKAAPHKNAVSHALKSRGEFNYSSFSMCEKTYGKTASGWSIVDGPVNCRRCLSAIRAKETT